MGFVGTDEGYLYAITPNGWERWSFEANDKVREITVSDGTVYFASSSNRMYAVDAETGDKKWKYVLGGLLTSGGQVKGGQTVYNNTLYFGLSTSKNKGRIYAIDAETGSKQWSTDVKIPVHTAPDVDKNLIYIGIGSNLYAVNRNTGEKQWSYDTGAKVRSGPNVRDGVVYAGNDNGQLYALNKQTGKKVWTYKCDDSATHNNHYTGNDIIYRPQILSGNIYFGSQNGYFYSLNNKGEEEWKFATDGPAATSPIAVDNMLFCLSRRVDGKNSKLYAIRLPE